MSKGGEHCSKGGEKASRECPECHSMRIWKDGIRETKHGSVQRCICRDCGYRFSDRSFLLINLGYNGERQVCAILTEAKNLTEVGSLDKGLAGATKDIKGKVVEFLWHLEKENRSKRTIRSYSTYLKMLEKKGSDLSDSQSVKESIAKQESWGENTKRMAATVYKSFADFCGISFIPPKYRINQKVPFIPLEAEIDSLIAGSPKRLATLLQLLKEAPMRVGEGLLLKWTDIDLERGVIYLNKTEKDGKPRTFKISDKLFSMLNTLEKKGEKVFGKADYRSMENQFVTVRKRIAFKLQNTRLRQIHFHTLRHWKATMEYKKTRDILHVMKLLGHKNLESTLVYTQLIDFESDEFHSATARTDEEATKLVEEGFEYVCTTPEDTMLFRKRK